MAAVRIQSTYVGQMVRRLDPTEEKFTVFFITPSPGIPEHSEIWVTREWKESNSYRFIRQQASEKERAEVFNRQDKTAEIFQKLRDKCSFLAEKKEGRLLAENIAREMKNLDIMEEITKRFNITINVTTTNEDKQLPSGESNKDSTTEVKETPGYTQAATGNPD
jgi:hypothetical protein